MLRIEKALEEDLVEILDLQKNAFLSEAKINNDYTIPPLMQTIESIANEFKNSVFLKATKDNKIVGSVRANEKDGVCNIGRLIVHPDFENRGIGTKLMVSIEELFKNCNKYEVFTGEKSNKNLYLYNKLGYKEFKRSKITDKLTLLYLEKDNMRAIMNQKAKVFEVLHSLNIDFEVMNHKAVFTVEDMDEIKITEHGDVCKNLFLRDAKGERHFIVVLDKDKKADLKAIQNQLNCTRLGFASEERLYQYLQLHKGEVSPLAIINDNTKAVEVVIDNDLAKKNRLGFHPNDNTATVWISYEGLKKFIEEHDRVIHLITI